MAIDSLSPSTSKRCRNASSSCGLDLGTGGRVFGSGSLWCALQEAELGEILEQLAHVPFRGFSIHFVAGLHLVNDLVGAARPVAGSLNQRGGGGNRVGHQIHGVEQKRASIRQIFRLNVISSARILFLCHLYS